MTIREWIKPKNKTKQTQKSVEIIKKKIPNDIQREMLYILNDFTVIINNKSTTTTTTTITTTSKYEKKTIKKNTYI